MTGMRRHDLKEFDDKAGRLQAFCREFVAEHQRWPEVREVVEAKLDGMRSSVNAGMMLRYVMSVGLYGPIDS